MDKYVLILSVIVIASGCTSIIGDDEDQDDLESSPAQGKGLEVASFTLTDNTLTPGQQAVASLALENNHIVDIGFDQISFYNQGELEITQETSCGNQIEASSSGYVPRKECTWVIEAPSEQEISPFQSKNYNPRLLIKYDSQLTNVKNNFKITFKPGTDIESTNSIKKSYNNGEMKATLSSDSPVPVEGSATLDIELKPVHEKHVVSDTYGVSITPGDIITGDCAQEGTMNNGRLEMDIEPQLGKEASITCQISSNTRKQVERNVIVATSYKYQQTPALNIEVKSTDD